MYSEESGGRYTEVTAAASDVKQGTQPRGAVFLFHTYKDVFYVVVLQHLYEEKQALPR